MYNVFKEIQMLEHILIFVDFDTKKINLQTNTCPSGVQNSCSFSFSSSLVENRAMNSKKERLGTELMSR